MSNQYFNSRIKRNYWKRNCSQFNRFGNLFNINQTHKVDINSAKINLGLIQEVDEYFKNSQYYEILIFLVGLAHSKGSSATKRRSYKD